MTDVATQLSPNPAKGQQTATVGTEHTLASTSSLAAGASFVLKVDVSNMVDGDVLELRVYANANGVAADKLAYPASLANSQTTQLSISIPIAVGVGGRFKATLKQVAGTGRAFDWEVIQL